MPGGLVPHKSGAHRLACLSLYRALLKQCSKFSAIIASNPDAASTIQSFVRYRFRKDQRLQSPSQIANGLEAGYNIFSLLASCTSTGAADANGASRTSLKTLTQLLVSTSELAEATAAARAHQTASWKQPRASLEPRIKHFQTITTKANLVRRPENPHILERPLPLSEIKSGKRLVPHLVSTQGFPFLRYGKPQPPALSRMIRQRTRWAEKRWAQRKDLEAQIILAEMEDQWDNIIIQDFGIGDYEAGMDSNPNSNATLTKRRERGRFNSPLAESSCSWTDELRQAISEITSKLREYEKKAAVMGRKMWEIVLKEKELARQEKLHTKLERRRLREEARKKNMELESNLS